MSWRLKATTRESRKERVSKKSSHLSRQMKSEATSEMKSLDQQCWYHGLCSREDAELLLTKPGNFLVRASESQGCVNIVLSLYTGDRKVHLTIDCDDQGQFYLKAMKEKDKSRQFATVYDLVRHYKSHRIKLKSTEGPNMNYRLREGVPRPKWQVQSDAIAFDCSAKPLGTGHFADVYLGTFYADKKLDEDKGILVAIKVLKTQSGANSEAEREAKQGMIKEGKVMSFYNHPNVVQFYGTACDRPQQIILVMEYCPGGSLDKHLVEQKERILVGERLTFCIESALGMRYLHSQGCLHRDLAARNCLISAKGVVKISDFGLSAVEGATGIDKLGNMPIRWMSPETLVKDPFFSTKSDVWAYGILVYEVFSMGVPPWLGEDNKKVATWIRRCMMPEMPAITPQPVKELVKSIWIKTCEDRPSFRDIVMKLGIIRECGIKMPPPGLCSVNQIPDVCRTAIVEDLSDDKTGIMTAGLITCPTASSGQIGLPGSLADQSTYLGIPQAVLKPSSTRLSSQYLPRTNVSLKSSVRKKLT